jgi:hypothetical protein
MVNISDFSKIGLSSVKDSSAFKKIQYHSKSPTNQLFDTSTLNYSKFDTLSALYNNNLSFTDSKDYYTDRQDNYSGLLVSQLNSTANLDNKSVAKFLDFNFGLSSTKYKPSFFNNNASSNLTASLHDSNSAGRANYTLSRYGYASDVKNRFLDLSQGSTNINMTTDGKYYNNPVRLLLSPSFSRKLSMDLPILDHLDLSTNSALSEAASKFSNVESSSKFKDLKSGNMSFLSPDKNVRLISKLHTSRGQLNFSESNSNLDDILNHSLHSGSSVSESSLYRSSTTD